MQTWLYSLRDWWRSADRTARLAMVGGAVGVFLLLVGLAFWAATPSFEVLYTDLTPADSAQVVARLKEKGIPVRVSGNGSVIEVPAKSKEEARLELASQGLPRSGAPGYTRLEKSSLGMTQAIEQNTLRIALEEELQNTIQHLEPVESARVHITLGNDSPFADSKQEATASVVVHLKPQAMLTRQQIQGIVHLISHSVEGLTPERVSIVDGQARPLWDGTQMGEMGTGWVSTRREAERTYAEELRRAIQQQLDEVVGPGKSTVMVRAELNFDKEEVQSQQVQPLGAQGAVLSETSSEERLRGNPPVPGGPTGIAANRANPLQYPAAAPTGGGPGEYTRAERLRNYELNKNVIHSIKAPGRIERLSVAVLIDESVPEATVNSIRHSIETIIGVSPTAPGRQVTCQRIAFDTSHRQKEASEYQRLVQARRMELLWRYLPLFFLLAIAFFLVRILMKSIAKPPLPQPLAAITAGGERTLVVGGAESGMVSLTHEGEDMEPDGGVQSEVFLPPIAEDECNPELRQVLQLARTRPDQVALLLKTWLKGE